MSPSNGILHIQTRMLVLYLIEVGNKVDSYQFSSRSTQILGKRIRSLHTFFLVPSYFRSSRWPLLLCAWRNFTTTCNSQRYLNYRPFPRTRFAWSAMWSSMVRSHHQFWEWDWDWTRCCAWYALSTQCNTRLLVLLYVSLPPFSFCPLSIGNRRIANNGAVDLRLFPNS